MGRLTRLRMWLLVVTAVVLALGACSPNAGPASTGSSTGIPATARIIFLQQGPDRRMLMVADPDGRHPSSLLPANLSALAASASADGQVLAVVTVGLGATEPGDQLWVVRHGRTRSLPVPPGQSVYAVQAAPDGRVVYYLLGDSVMTWRVATETVSTLCAHCAPSPSFPPRAVLAVSPDAATVAVTEIYQNHLPGSLPTSTMTVRDAASGRLLWQAKASGGQGPAVGQTFADNDTLVEVLGDWTGSDPTIRLVSGLRSGHAVDTASGVLGYDPQRLDGMWWYYRDSTAGVTTVYVNPDLTPARERKLVDRIDGPTSFDYQPVTTVPRAVSPPTTTSPTPSS